MKKTARTLVMVLMGLTAVMTLLGGAGTSCAAFRPEQFDSMIPLIPYQWLYQILVIATIATSLLGFWATRALQRGRPQALKATMAFLVLGLLLGIIQMIASYNLRGEVAPTNMRVYLTTLTLLVLLTLRLPGIRDRVNWDSPDQGGGSTAGMTFFLVGLLTLTTPLWAGPTHMENGYNLVYVLRVPLLAGGGAMTLLGIAFLLRVTLVSYPLIKQNSTLKD